MLSSSCVVNPLTQLILLTSMLKQQIEQDLIVALKSRDENTVSTLKMLKSAIKNKEIELIKELDEEAVVKIIMSEVKKRKDSIFQFENGNRIDLADKERAEINVLEKYLPEMLSDEEIKKIIYAIINEEAIEKNPSNFGKIMKLVMERVSGKVEGNRVSVILKEELK